MKGFIGPIGDDLPSILSILLALSLFFSGLSFTLDVYNQRLDNFNQLKGTMDIARKVTSDGLILNGIDANDLRDSAKDIAKSYGLDFCVKFDSKNRCNVPGGCKSDWVKFTYLVAYQEDNGDIELDNLEVCAG